MHRFRRDFAGLLRSRTKRDAEVRPLMSSEEAAHSQFLGNGKHRHVGSREADVVFVLYSPYHEPERTSGLCEVRSCNGNIVHASHFDYLKKRISANLEEMDKLPDLFSLLDDIQPHTVREFRLALLKDLCKRFSSRGFTVRLFKSYDGVFIFMRVSIEPGLAEEVLARKHRVRLHTTTELIQGLGIGQDLSKVVTAYAEYDGPHSKIVKEKCGVRNVYQTYHNKYRQGSLLRSSERIRLIYHVFSEVLDLSGAVECGFVRDHYPVHSQYALSEFMTDWARLELVLLTLRQPITRMREYFGEAITFYYAWIGFTVRCVLFMTFPALLIWISQYFFSYALIISMAVWVVFFIVFESIRTLLWRRKESYFKECWDMEETNLAQLRPGWRFYWRTSIVDSNERERYYPYWKRLLLRGASWMITLLCMAGVAYMVVNSYGHLRGILDQSVGRFYRVSRSAVTGITMSLGNLIWKQIAPQLVKMENPKTIQDFKSSLMSKLFAFQAVNSYWLLAWLSYRDAFTLSDTPPDYSNEFRIIRLQSTIFTTYCSVAACDILAAIVLWILVKLRVRRTRLAVEKRFRSTGEAVHNEAPKLCFMEQQFDLDVYTTAFLVIDEIDCTITFGYMLLFGVVSPLIVVVCFLVLVLQMRINSFMLCNLYRRPLPLTASGNDHAMHRNLDILNWLGLANSIAIPLFNLQRFCQTPRLELWCIFFVAEHVCILLKALANSWLARVSDTEKNVRKQRDYVLRKFRRAGDDEILQDVQTEMPSWQAEDIREIDQYCSEWYTLESEDTDFPMTAAEVPEGPSANPDGGFDLRVDHLAEVHDTHGSQIF